MTTINLVSLFLPNLGSTLVGIIYILVGLALLGLGIFLTIEGVPKFLRGIVSTVGVALLILGIINIFVISFIQDILNDTTALTIVIGSLLIGFAYNSLYGGKKK